MVSRIAVLITDMFEDIEYTEPAKAFWEAGHDLIHVDLPAGETVHGKKEQIPGTIDRNASDVSPDNFGLMTHPSSSCGGSSGVVNRFS